MRIARVAKEAIAPVTVACAQTIVVPAKLVRVARIVNLVMVLRAAKVATVVKAAKAVMVAPVTVANAVTAVLVENSRTAKTVCAVMPQMVANKT